MPRKIDVPEPEEVLQFIDVHCHLPFPRRKNNQLPSDREQYENFFKLGGQYLITSTIDIHTLNLTLNFMKNLENNFGFTCGWAPQTVTYTPKNKYDSEWQKWIDFILNNSEKCLGIGEIGLDFHHAKTLDKRNSQVDVFRQILELTKDLDKPYILHVRNATEHEFDRQNPKHRFNKRDGANKEILRILKEFNITLKKFYGIVFQDQRNMVEHYLIKVLCFLCQVLHMDLNDGAKPQDSPNWSRWLLKQMPIINIHSKEVL